MVSKSRRGRLIRLTALGLSQRTLGLSITATRLASPWIAVPMLLGFVGCRANWTLRWLVVVAGTWIAARRSAGRCAAIEDRRSFRFPDGIPAWVGGRWRIAGS